MNDIKLTPGACRGMHEAEQGDLSSWAPRIQCVSVKLLPTAAESTTARYRLILSDGEFYMQVMLNTQLNHLLESLRIQKYSTFKVTMIANNLVQNKRLVIILKIDESSIVAADNKIGEPVALEPKPDPSLTALHGSIQKSAPSTSAAAPTTSPGQPPSAHSNAATSTRTSAQPASTGGGERPAAVMPIEGLSPYQNKWTIKARVTQKSDIKHWSNPRGDGKLFSCTFLDNTGEIKATAFNAAADEHFDKIREGGVYYVSRARVNVAKKKFSNLPNDYEITLEKTSEVVECHDSVDAPQIRYNFVRLDQMENLQKDATCDVVAIVHEVGPVGEIVSRTTNKPVTKRELILVDRSEQSIRMTLWGKTAETFTNEDHPVVAFRGVKVGDYGGRNLGMFSGSSMQVDPDIPDAHTLRGWYDSSGSNTSFRSQGGGLGVSTLGGGATFRREDVKTLNVVQETLLGLGDKPDYFSARVRVVHVKQENVSYTACPGPNCQKKVIEQDDGSWRCEKCGKSYPECEYRYLLSISCADHTGQIWLQGFNEVGEMMLGLPAKDLHELYENDRDAFVKKLNEAIGKQWNLSCRVKQETYNDVTRARYGINRAYPLNYAEEGHSLLEQLKSYPDSVTAH